MKLESHRIDVDRDGTRILRIQAPSNIALVKYMGKDDASRNLPANGSLSMTLDSLSTVLELELREMKGAVPVLHWDAGASPAGSEAFEPVELSERGVSRLRAHLERCHQRLPGVFKSHGIELGGAKDLTARSANSFPSDAGIASSASSFAAFTLGFAGAMASDPNQVAERLKSSREFRKDLAAISREGSGSSCRSFAGPFVAWEGEFVSELESKLPKMADLVILVSSAKKEVSSSEAHRLTPTSPLWSGRVARANLRVRQLKEAIASGNLPLVAKIAWDEAWEMHSLFHTCEQPFTYWQPETISLLRWLKPFVEGGGDTPPVVTLDAGPNVHLLVPEAQASEWRARLGEYFSKLPVLHDTQGGGARFVLL